MPTDPWQRRTREIAETVRALRVKLGLSQEELALAAGVSRNHIQVLERGVGEPVNPRLATLYALAAALGVRVADLLPRDAR